jgi:hypothetical protein
MSWEWIGPVATAIVGLAGIAGTWLTGRAARHDQRDLFRMQYDEARESFVRETRRRAFIEFTANLHGLLLYCSTPLKMVSDEVFTSSQHELIRSYSEVKLLGHDLVRQHAQHAISAVTDLSLAKLANEDQEKLTKLQTKLQNIIFMLERLMAADLGIPVNRSGDERNKDIDTIIESIIYMERMKAELNDPSGGSVP